MQIFSMAMMHLFLPGFTVFWLWNVKLRSKAHWFSLSLLGSGVVFGLFVIGVWGWFGLLFRYLFPLLLVAGSVSGLRRTRGLPWFAPEGVLHVIQLGVAVISGLLGWLIALVGFSGYAQPAGSVDVRFPLDGGSYIVGHGGANPIINYHNAIVTQRYALDIGGMTPMTTRAWGLYPKQNERYAIYGATLLSPCDGFVAAARDTLPDMVPPARDTQQVAGNFVALNCRGATGSDTMTVYMAHMQPGSAAVSVGDSVHAGDPIGRVGNSGNTTEPHLHIHAEEGAYTGTFSGQAGVPLTFDGRWLVRSSVARR